MEFNASFLSFFSRHLLAKKALFIRAYRIPIIRIFFVVANIDVVVVRTQRIFRFGLPVTHVMKPISIYWVDANATLLLPLTKPYSIWMLQENITIITRLKTPVNGLSSNIGR